MGYLLNGYLLLYGLLVVLWVTCYLLVLVQTGYIIFLVHLEIYAKGL